MQEEQAGKVLQQELHSIPIEQGAWAKSQNFSTDVADRDGQGMRAGLEPAAQLRSSVVVASHMYARLRTQGRGSNTTLQGPLVVVVAGLQSAWRRLG